MSPNVSIFCQHNVMMQKLQTMTEKRKRKNMTGQWYFSLGQSVWFRFSVSILLLESGPCLANSKLLPCSFNWLHLVMESFSTCHRGSLLVNDGKLRVPNNIVVVPDQPSELCHDKPLLALSWSGALGSIRILGP